jgi:hypothetical protein
MVDAQDDIPETWDTIKYEKPIFPTVSRGKNGSAVYVNNKYHCYSVLHIKPVHNLTPYRATGFGFGERSMKYIPLTHVQNRSKPKPPNIVNEKSEMKKIYETSIDTVKSNIRLRYKDRLQKELDETEIRNVERQNSNLVNKMKYEIHNMSNKTGEMIGDVRYRTHCINRVLRYNDF